MMDDKQALLRRYFGHDGFRPGQEALIDALCAGRDALGVMPTGAGKSMCYQLPALLLPGMTLVISPLISLMKDQVAALAQMGIPAAYINSSLTLAQQLEALRRARMGAYKLIYVAPERLTAESFLDFACESRISLLAVDEAHCVSQWGQDFRPSYLDIAAFASQLPQRPVIGAFTATATEQVKLDIEKLLQLRDPLRVTTGFDRPNLFFDVERPRDKAAFLDAFLRDRPAESGIIYCATRKTVESVCERLSGAGIAATRYHAGLSDAERRENQDAFVYDRKRVMVATNAFGMGIDKSNVSFVLHYNMPKNIESYYQEAGRAGRDGAEARCVLLYSSGDVQTARFLIENSEENDALTDEERAALRARDLERLSRMSAYCKTTDCLRQYLLSYFGQESPDRCGNCGSCSATMERLDITIDAQKILSGVVRVERRFSYRVGATLIIRMLHGSRAKRILELGLDRLPTYGIMREQSREQIQDEIDALIGADCLKTVQSDGYTLLTCGPQAQAVLFHDKQVFMTRRKQAAFSIAPKVKIEDSGLLGRLKMLRSVLATRESVPAYVVFSNATLEDMAEKQPTTITEFLTVSGVGAVKAERYGDAFVNQIKKWRAEKQE